MGKLLADLRFAAASQMDAGSWVTDELPQALVEACRRRRHPRTDYRLVRRTAERLGLGSMAVRDIDSVLPRDFDMARLDEASILSGAVWHAERIKWMIDRDHRERLKDKLGLDVIPTALRLRKLAQANSVPTDAGIVADAIRDDGERCLQAWLASLDAPVRARLELLRPTRSIRQAWEPERAAKGIEVISAVFCDMGMPVNA